MRMPVFIFVLFTPVIGWASQDVVRTIEFLGFSEDGKKFLLKVTDADRGDSLSLRSFATGKSEKEYPIEDPKQEKKMIEAAKKKHKITDPGKDSQQSPDGRYTIVGIPKGDKYLLNVQKGEKMTKFQAISIDKGVSTGNYAKVTLKSVFWSKDGHRIVVIVHKKLVDEWGIDADEAYPYEFFGGSL